MAAASFFGHALLGLGPGIAFFIIIIAPKSFVVLLSLFSAFLWLVVLLLTSAVLRGFVPLAATQPAYAGALLTAVCVEELARYGVWRLHKKTVAVLHRMSVSSGHTFTPVDELYLAVGWGYGQAAVHVLIMFASLLPLTAGHGTLYTEACPQVRTPARSHNQAFSLAAARQLRSCTVVRHCHAGAYVLTSCPHAQLAAHCANCLRDLVDLPYDAGAWKHQA